MPLYRPSAVKRSAVAIAAFVSLLGCREVKQKTRPPPVMRPDTPAPMTPMAPNEPTAIAGQPVGNAPDLEVVHERNRTVFVHLFEWRWDDVADECERFLGPRGFKAVQVSPPQEHAVFDDGTWWQRYQPVSYQLVSRGGTRAEFVEMVERCRAADVEIYVDAVLNHMSFRPEGVGSAGTNFTKYNYPGLYTDEHFHDCRRGIEDWSSVEEIQTCELATLPDLRTAVPHVREQLANYLSDLDTIGVRGYRFDAAKHMPADDLAAILQQANLTGSPFVFQEVVSLDGNPPLEPPSFTRNGRVTEFRYGQTVSDTFRSGSLTDLPRLIPTATPVAGWVPSESAVVFIDNHDTQRGHGAGDPLMFRQRALYELANVFMLAHPYGAPKIMSSYAFSGGDEGPPAGLDGTPSSPAPRTDDRACDGPWICEHRWPSIANMVEFRNATRSARGIDNWWSNGNDQIAFSRGNRGFVAINREETHRLTAFLATGLPQGLYCDAFTGRIDERNSSCTGRRIVVDAEGKANLVIEPLAAVAIHIDARIKEVSPPAPEDWTGEAPGLGAHFDDDASHVRFSVFSQNASAIELSLFGSATGTVALSIPLNREGESTWSVAVPIARIRASGVPETIYYGYRAWGPNWPKSGFVTDVDEHGNRFNPNKLLVDPYARELSHDAFDLRPHATGPEFRDIDNGVSAPKGIVLARGSRPEGRPAVSRAMADEIIYEVHLRGFTNNDPSVPESLRGTYAGAATKARYLKELGVTAIELLPLHETTNDQNELTANKGDDNYWGYASNSFFAPDRRYAADRSPGGPTRELKAMVDAFHAEGIEVFVDVVYNHTVETGTWDSAGQVATLTSWRGLDNTSYYQLERRDATAYANNNGVGPNFDVGHPAVRALIIASLQYWANEIGVDGFRFDLAAVLGNTCDAGCFEFSHSELLTEIRAALPNTKLIAEPWGIGPGTYQIGNFGPGWAEWNGIFRDTVRRDQNEEGRTQVTLQELANVLRGSPQLFADDGRAPFHSINFVASHDGFALRDVYSCNAKDNDQPWPFGPSPGGDNQNHGWDQGGDVALQRSAARTGLALLMVASGVPMFNGGDELYRTQYCNNNPFNIDSDKNWLDWQNADASFGTFVRRLLRFRHSQPNLRDGSASRTLHDDSGAIASTTYLLDPAHHFLGMRIGGNNPVYVAYNGWSQALTATLPAGDWRLVGDTSSAFEARGGILEEAERTAAGANYLVPPKSVVLFVGE